MKPIDYWEGMPEFIQRKVEPAKKIKIIFIDGTYLFIRFETTESYNLFQYRSMKYNFCKTTSQRDLLSKVSDQKITEKTKSIWFPFKSHWGGIKYKYTGSPEIKNRYPVYIVSKGRSKNCLTSKSLNKMGINHFLVVERSQLEDYRKSKQALAEILILPDKYLEEYDTCDNLGRSKSIGPGAARNFCIDHSMSQGNRKHWVMDDNLDAFHYLNKNEKYEVECAATLAAAEDFTDRFSNVPISGMNYYSFCKKNDPVPPFKFNTRIYSCLLIDNHAGYRWRGRYNEDTDICLRVLKDGLCTIQFNAFLCGKVTTQRMKGGNTEEFYSKEGTKAKSQMLEDLHPDVASVVWRFNRWHHHVNYKAFESNNPEMVELLSVMAVNNYGLELTGQTTPSN
jgi:hypothetical protein